MTKLKLIGLLAVDVSGFGIVMSADSQPVELLDGENRVLAGAPRIRNPILIRDGGGFRGLIGYVGTEAIDRQSTSEWLSAFGASRAEDSLAGSLNTETFFKELLAFGKTLTQEEARALSEGLSEELLAIFDLLMRPAPELSEAEKVQVKKVAEELLTVLKRDKIVLDWRKQPGHASSSARFGRRNA